MSRYLYLTVHCFGSHESYLLPGVETRRDEARGSPGSSKLDLEAVVLRIRSSRVLEKDCV